MHEEKLKEITDQLATLNVSLRGGMRHLPTGRGLIASVEGIDCGRS